MGTIAKRGALVATLVVVVGGGLLGSASASAEAPPPVFTQFPQDGIAGSGPSQMAAPLGVASDPATGHVYVSEAINNRISEFTAWGEFVKAWGWGVSNGAAELQVCTAASGCQQGLAGAGPGQFSLPTGLAVDGSGAIYAVDKENHRVQKFNSAGEFVLMFGGEVNKTTKANVCTKASGDVCGIGTVGSAAGQFGNWNPFARNIVDVGPAGTIFVGGDQNRIQEFNPDGTYKAQVPLPAGRSAIALAVDRSSGDFWVVLNSLSPFFEPRPVYKLSAGTGAILKEVDVGDPAAEPFPIKGAPEALATDSAGNVYVVVELLQIAALASQGVVKLKADGSCLICAGERFANPVDGSSLGAPGTSSACGVAGDTLYVSHLGGSNAYVRAFGSTPDPTLCPAPLAPPQISAQYAVSVDSDGALVRAQINPRFWADTEFRVEYGSEECSKGGCQILPLNALGGKPVSFPVTTTSVFLAGLQPGKKYHYRFVAQSSGGGPVKGIGGKVGEDGAESTFTTPRAPSEPRPCPANQQFRTGPSARLPDCRAYEMVSPLDKDSGDIVPLRSINAYPAGLAQSTPAGNGLTYSSYRAFGAPQSAPYTSQYIAVRDPGAGWRSEAIAAPREGGSFFNTAGLDSQYKGFSSDLCSGWFLQDAEPRLDPAAPAGFGDLYRRDNCGGGSYRALNATAPTLTPSFIFLPVLQGFSADGSCAVFRANDKLTADASSKVVTGAGIYQLYESCGGPLRLVSVLPNGTASQLESSAGTRNKGNLNRVSNLWHAVSASGSRVYWTADESSGDGKIYVRENADREQSAISGGECTEAGQACTYPVSETVSAGDARFWGASSSGSVAFFSIGANLYEYDFESGVSTLIAGQMAGWMGAADNGSRLYFASREARAPGAVAGAVNLYLYDREAGAGDFTFVATLSELDTGGELSPIAQKPDSQTSRVSPDGGHVTFMSRSKALSELTAGYDNTDAKSGEPDAEVYLYDAAAGGGAGSLACASCNPSGARPSGRELVVRAQPTGIWAAAQIPVWQNQLSASRVLSNDGSRLYFESFDALVPRDTNNKQDVYQWEAAGKGDCQEGDSSLEQGSGGCLSLISSGEGPEDSRFVDATPSGSDVFFATGSSLLPQDYGLVDIYDARAGGGFPPPLLSKPPCEGEACQSPPPAPSDPTPSSSTFQGKGNESPRRCAKNKRRVVRGGKARCVAKPRKPTQRQKQKQKQKGRAGR